MVSGYFDLTNACFHQHDAGFVHLISCRISLDEAAHLYLRTHKHTYYVYVIYNNNRQQQQQKMKKENNTMRMNKTGKKKVQDM